jgi:flagellar motility protein MotE (MotC chaperone)
MILSRPRLLPCVIVAASGLLGVKLVDVWSSGTAVIEAAEAQSAAATQSAPQTASTDAQNSQTPPPSEPASQPSSAAGTPAPTSGASATAPDPQTLAAQASAQPSTAAPDKAPDKAKTDPLQMSAQEIDELQQLSQRRVELDKRTAELSEREVLLQATEKRIDEKIAKLQALQSSIEGTVKQQSADDQARVQSLAHMYEQMKPEDAARVFNQLDVPVVLTMMSMMRELKAAPILAAMDPAKAKAVTIALTDAKSADATRQQAAPSATPQQPQPQSQQ